MLGDNMYEDVDEVVKNKYQAIHGYKDAKKGHWINF